MPGPVLLAAPGGLFQRRQHMAVEGLGLRKRRAGATIGGPRHWCCPPEGHDNRVQGAISRRWANPPTESVQMGVCGSFTGAILAPLEQTGDNLDPRTYAMAPREGRERNGPTIG